MDVHMQLIHPFAAVFIPAALLCMRAFYPCQPAAQRTMLAAALLQPAAVLIDHGHFQYNNISLGLTVTREHIAVNMLATLALMQ